MIAPPGARLPRSTAMLPSRNIGSAMLRTTSCAKPGPARSISSPSVRPVTVNASRRSSGFNSRSSVAMPPALWKSSM